ncbi:26S proteasome non-ATPase regulatory subunit 10 isoform X1 [Accipiter gentilis]|uniref:26S proteasome non-ATPase regulatory subunit 10 isoform X1 n=1 Tax=Astur gentilis TaxID=8957 RepID=UPI0021109DD3|nr:26S proteasome non-ATPase regulatory subunit 10 isoform X1 [Accipiter gentilis]
MEGAVSDVGICNLAYAGRLEELRAQLLRDRALATKADQDNRTALHWACSAGHTDVADLLLGLGVPVNDKDDAGWTPLHIAASAGRDEIVKALIAKGAHVNAINQNGCTPLHYAASKNKQEIAIMLLENGADPDATDHFESTPLHRAAAKGNLKMVQILLQHNASVNIRDSEGNTPLIKATVFQHNGILLKHPFSSHLLHVFPLSFSGFGVRSATEPGCYKVFQNKLILAETAPQSILVSVKLYTLKKYI